MLPSPTRLEIDMEPEINPAVLAWRVAQAEHEEDARIRNEHGELLWQTIGNGTLLAYDPHRFSNTARWHSDVHAWTYAYTDVEASVAISSPISRFEGWRYV